jgi:N6-L-threonylcarbamoyladenine synthase
LREAQHLVGHDHTLPSAKLPGLLNQEQKNDIAASFQQTVVAILTERVLAAFALYKPKSVVIAGGVAANQALRARLKDALPIDIHYAPMNLCTDNAAMIASLGYYQADKAVNPSALYPNPVLSM